MHKTLEINTYINKPKEDVWKILSSLEAYSTWNPLTKFRSKPIIEKWIVMKVKLFGFWLSVPVKVKSLNIEEGVRWIGGIPLLVTGSHYFKLVDCSDGTTKLVQGEDFEGILVPLLMPFLTNKLLALYEGFNNSITEFSESEKAIRKD
jgi:hypothetical protein